MANGQYDSNEKNVLDAQVFLSIIRIFPIKKKHKNGNDEIESSFGAIEGNIIVAVFLVIDMRARFRICGTLVLSVKVKMN